MPRYAYKCVDCGAEVEEILRVSELGTAVVDCPNPDCFSEKPMERQATSASLSFKGPGWTPKHYGGK